MTLERLLKTISLFPNNVTQRLVTLSGADGKTIVKKFTFGDDQVQAVRLIAR